MSEVMLQQTQVPRVEPRWRRWMARWPTVEALAAAAPAEAIEEWSGLGYNRRAVNLHRAAAAVVERGGFPRTIDGLCDLPGVGPYTAAAIACFAFGAQVAAPDTNARRVLERAFGDPGLAPPAGRAYEWNQALFDLGSQVCIARRPRCEICPLASGCPSRGRTFPPLRRQSAFEGSFRQRRGRLLREVMQAGRLDEAAIDAEALTSLLQDGLVEVADGAVRLPRATPPPPPSAPPATAARRPA
ncbi:MAG: A/G-specific adenine glycosylase [Gaiellales bacterium]